MSANKPHTLIFDSAVLCDDGAFKTETLPDTLRNLKQAGIRIFVVFEMHESFTLSRLFRGLATTYMAKTKEAAVLQCLPLSREEWSGIQIFCPTGSPIALLAQQKGLSLAELNPLNEDSAEDLLCGMFGEKIKAAEVKSAFTGPHPVQSTKELHIQSMEDRSRWRKLVARISRTLHPHKPAGGPGAKQKVG